MPDPKSQIKDYISNRFLRRSRKAGDRIFYPKEMKVEYPMDIQQIGEQTKTTLGNTGKCLHRLAYKPLRLYTPYRRINAIHLANAKEVNVMYMPGC